MDNNIQIFEHEEFGEIRTIEIDGKIYFVGLDVAKALGYKNPSKTISTKIKEHHKLKMMLPHYQNGKVVNSSMTTVIDESGFYSLVLASNLKDAEEFQEWVTSEVLPTIRKTGTYSMNPPQIEEKSKVYIENYIENLNITNNYIEEKPKRSTSKKYRKGDTKFMTFNISQLHDKLEDYLQRKGVDTSKRNGFPCLICGSKDGCFLVPEHNNQVWKCFSLKHSNYPKDSGDIIEYVKQLENVDFQKACEILSNMYGMDTTDTTITSKLSQKEEKIRINLYNMALQNQPQAVDYLKKRGIIHADEIAQEFQIGFMPNYAYEFENNKPSKTTPVVIIPMSDTSYSWRSTTENLKKKSGTIIPLNLNALQDTSKRWFFLCEGEFDMFSILDITKDIPNCEFSAICLSSAVNLEKFIKTYIANNIQDNMGLIIALDNDREPNPNVENFTQKGLDIAKKNKIPCVVADVKSLYLNQKDSNEALKFNREEFKKALINQVEKAKTLDIAQYMAECDKIIDSSKKLEVSIYDWDDVGRIDRAYSFTKDCLRYCKQSNSWYQYDSNYGILRKNLTDKFIDKLHRQIKNHLQEELEVYKLKDKKNLESDNKTSYAKDFHKEMKSSITEKAFQNTLNGVARHGNTPITLIDLDNPTLLNLKDATLDLTTLEPHEHSIDDLCTKYVDTELNTPLNPQAIADWNKFISDIMCNDPQMIEFLQRVCGYILEVANKEECFFILYGRTTRNGKSTLLGAISGVLKDYVKTVSSTTLSERPTGKEANPEVINLIGAKLITCGELNSETLLNDTLLKSISGNDPQSARNLFSNDILNFKIDGKLFANCNELPPMKNDDLLNSMRIIVIPFDRHFEEFEQDKNLKKRFNRAEYKAVILQWILTGYKRYLKYGIKAHMPKKVIRAIEEYHSEANSINAFLNDTTIFERIDRSNYEECVKLDDNGIKKLYPRYIEWCNENGCKPLSSLNFKKQLRKNRLYKKRGTLNNTLYLHCLCSYKLRPSATFTDERNSSNPDRLVTISQRDLELLKK